MGAPFALAGQGMDPADMEANAVAACTLLKSMANESRLMILCQLASGEKSVGDLLDIVPLSQSAMSQHLALLRRERLVRTRRAAQTIYYSLISDEVMAVMATLYTLYCDTESRQAPGRARKRELA
jgi:DNA-binding transcriptional ArsR family regulator